MTEKAVFDEPNDRALQDSLDMIVVEPNENNNDRNLLRGDRNLFRGSFCYDHCRGFMPGACHLVYKRCWPSKCVMSIRSNDETFNPSDHLLMTNSTTFRFVAHSVISAVRRMLSAEEEAESKMTEVVPDHSLQCAVLQIAEYDKMQWLADQIEDQACAAALRKIDQFECVKVKAD